MTILPHEKEIFEYERTLEQIKVQNKKGDLWSDDEIKKIENKLEKLKNKTFSNLSPWERVSICRHPKRPHAFDFLINLADEYEEIFGDRTYKDDHAVVTAFAKIDGQKFVFIGLEKGYDTDSRLYRNFGMAHPEGYRKALRAMKLAEKFHLPIISFLDTPGAYPGLTAEERGQGWAIAKNLFEMAQLMTPIIVVLIGEGCSGGALGIGVGDSIAMLEHAYYSVISPEGCASILWKDAAKNADAAEALKMMPEDLLSNGIIDSIIKEPMGGAHRNPKEMYAEVKKFLIDQRERLIHISSGVLIESRYQKFRNMGSFINEASSTSCTSK